MRTFGMIIPLAATLFASTAAHADLAIVATVPDLAALAKAIGGDHARVTAISVPTQDPHFVDARPNLMLDLSKADLLLLVGLDLELGWLPTLQTGSRNEHIQVGARGYLDCSQLVTLLEVPKVRLDRSMGDIHPGGNPHYLVDPRAAIRVAEGIAGRMSELDASNAESYKKNLKKLTNEIETARKSAEQALAPLRGAKVIGYHKTLAYLADWLGLEVIEHIEPRPGIPPNPSHVAEVIGKGKSASARAVFVEVYYPEGTARLVAEKIGARLIRLPGGADFRAGESYPDRVRRLTTLLRELTRGA
jgi:zinc/manganese transport system substrate-binding protein